VLLSRELNDARGLAWALCNLGMIAYEEAIHVSGRCWKRAWRSRNPSATRYALPGA
jgi:hypothetical protein